MGLKKIGFAFLVFLAFNGALIASVFSYDWNLQSTPGSGTAILCCHGYGSSGTKLLRFLTKHQATDHPLIGFNFPDYDLHQRFDAPKPSDTHFGTIQELLPALYAMKTCVVDQGMEVLNLYGMSAGGGAVINCLAVLNSHRYQDELQQMGIDEDARAAILQAVQQGVILLDVPLKSIDEIIHFRGEISGFPIIAERYLANDLRPIDSVKKLAGLSLNIVLFFQNPDEVLSNRDDDLFIEELKKANSAGQTQVIVADHGSHSSHHPLLWDAALELK
jgi:hypothetical protein